MLNAPPPHPAPPPGAGGAGSYNRHDFGEEVEWRSLLLYANPLGHRVPATLEICQKCGKHEPKTGARCNARCVCPPPPLRCRWGWPGPEKRWCSALNGGVHGPLWARA